MAKMSRGKIGLGAVAVLVCLLLSSLAAGQDCSISTLSGTWGYPPDWCCDAFAVTADQATVDPGATAKFTIGPPCPGATCTVTSNSGCAANKLACSVSEDGSKALVVVGGTACGSFDVTVTQAATASCAQYSASTTVRINNTGQGGAWVAVGYQERVNGNCSEGSNIWPCTVGKFRYADDPRGGGLANCRSPDQAFSISNGGCNPGDWYCPTCTGASYPCNKYDDYCANSNPPPIYVCVYGYCIWEWKCTCN